jgi:hypothetical protein
MRNDCDNKRAIARQWIRTPKRSEHAAWILITHRHLREIHHHLSLFPPSFSFKVHSDTTAKFYIFAFFNRLQRVSLLIYNIQRASGSYSGVSSWPSHNPPLTCPCRSLILAHSRRSAWCIDSPEATSPVAKRRQPQMRVWQHVIWRHRNRPLTREGPWGEVRAKRAKK